MTTTALFTADDLNALPEISGVTEAEATLVERVVWGWLKPILGLTERPDPVSDQLFSWAVELGVLYRSNPEDLESKRTGPFEETYGDRRDEILRLVAGGGIKAPGAPLKPVSSFPPARCYPDSSDRFSRWWD